MYFLYYLVTNLLLILPILKCVKEEKKLIYYQFIMTCSTILF